MGCDAGRDDAFFYVFNGRQAQVFRRRNVAQEVGTARCGNGTANGTGDVVIARSDIGD